MTTITQQSVQSLLLTMQFRGQPLGTATGFVAQTARGPVLITNWHVVSGRNPETNEVLSKTAGIPDEIVIIHNRKDSPGEWIPRTEKILGSKGHLWIEHPVLGKKVDFVALPLTQVTDVHLYPYSLGIGDPQIKCGTSDTVSVVGFPFGIQAGGSLAVWATGFVASEPDIDFNQLPIFLIDCRSREGQSGSPVISYKSGGMVAMDDGSSSAFNGPVSRFLGVYSGRVNKDLILV